MPTGAKKISQLPALTRNDSEIIPVVQDDGLGNLTTGTLPISDFGTDTNIYNTDGTLTGNRTVNNNGYSLTISATGSVDALILNAVNGSGLFAETTNGYGVYAISLNDVGVHAEGDARGVVGASTSGTGVYGVSSGGTGVLGASTSGTGVRAASETGKALWSDGVALIEENGAAGSISASAVLDVQSTVKGVLLPRMTTTQRNAIGTPATGLEIYNTTTNRKEIYNGTFWQGMAMRFLQVLFSTWNPTDAQTVAFGMAAGTPQLTSLSPAPYEIVMRGNGVIRGCDFTTFATGVAGSNENWSLYVRHQGTDYLVQTVGANTAVRTFTNTSLNIPYVAGDIVRMVFVNPTWATNPTNVAGGGFLTLQ
jgi:hypothetical protein